jgi:hypothetical protein
LGSDAFVSLEGSASYWVFEYLEVTRTAQSGIASYGTNAGIAVRNCYFHDIGNWIVPAGQVYSGYGMDAIGGPATASNWTIDGNAITNLGRTAWSGCTGSGCPIQQLDHGIYAGFNGAVISNNLFYNNTHGAQIQDHDGVNWQIINNTFAFPPFQPYAGDINVWGNNAGMIIRDNIFFEAGAQVVNVYQATAPNCAFDHNVVYPATTVFNTDVGCAVANNLNSDPKMVNTAAVPYDFQLQAGSPAIDAGVATATNHDFAGVLRPQGAAFDVGAYEYAAPQPPCSIPVNTLPGCTSTVVAQPPADKTCTSVIVVTCPR